MLNYMLAMAQWGSMPHRVPIAHRNLFKIHILVTITMHHSVEKEFVAVKIVNKFFFCLH